MIKKMIQKMIYTHIYIYIYREFDRPNPCMLVLGLALHLTFTFCGANCVVINNNGSIFWLVFILTSVLLFYVLLYLILLPFDKDRKGMHIYMHIHVNAYT